jgi:hypothetical protein
VEPPLPPPAPPPAVAISAPVAVAVEEAPRKEEAFYDLESLEAEMARLLGRDA